MNLPSLLVFAVFYAGLLALETLRPLRIPTRPKPGRLLANVSMGALGLAVTRLLLYPALLALAAHVSWREWGLLPQLGLPRPVSLALAFLLQDYGLYLWHWLNHNVEFLWRFHSAHHVDLDLDVTTGSRFHFGELAMSAVFRTGEILLLGLDPLAMLIYDGAAVFFVHFHHSNLRLPGGADGALARLIVTPRLHGIHHSIVLAETDSNFSTVFSGWDRLHRTYRADVPQAEIVIGVPAHRDPAETGFWRSLLLPFGPVREWRLPDGTVPERKGAGS